MTLHYYNEDTDMFDAICTGSIISKNFVLTVKSCVSRVLQTNATLDNLYILSNTTLSKMQFETIDFQPFSNISQGSNHNSVHRVEGFIPHRNHHHVRIYFNEYISKYLFKKDIFSVVCKS